MPRRRAGRPAPSRQSRAVARGVSCDAACRCSSSNIGSNPLSPSSSYPWSSSGEGGGGRAAPASAVQERPQPQRNPEALQGRVVVVTGGATGLGRAVALEFAQGGCGVAFNYVELPGRDVGAQALLTETAIKALGVPCYSAVCDVRKMTSVEQFVAEVRSKLGGVHYLVNNAGVTHDGALWRLTPEAWQEVMDTNVSGAFNCIHAVAPGFVKTELLTQLPREVLERAEHESVLGRVAEPEDVSRVILFLCSEAARHITGQVIVVDGGLTLA